MLLGEIRELLIHAIFAPDEMTLDLDVNVFAADGVDEKLRVFRGTLGSARVSRVGDGVSPSRTFGRLFWRDAKTNARDARAPQKSNNAFREFLELAPLHRAFAFRTAQMRLRHQLAQIFVASAILDQDR